MITQWPAIEMEEVTDRTELAAAAKQREQFDRNSAWLQQHIAEIYAKYRGRCICVAGENVFVADTAAQAAELAMAAHPEDQGWFTRYIPKEKVARIYAVRR